MQMYKVFFKDRIVFLSDQLPELAQVQYDHFSAFGTKEDLNSQLTKYLTSDTSGNMYIYHTDLDKLLSVFSSCFHEIPASGGLVKNSKNENLVIFRRGRWDLPKGKAEKGETSEQTAVREVEEECSIKGVQLIKFLVSTYHIYFLDDKTILKETKWYEMKYEGKKEPAPDSKEGITEIIWLPDDQLDKIAGNTFPTVMDVLNASRNQ